MNGALRGAFAVLIFTLALPSCGDSEPRGGGAAGNGGAPTAATGGAAAGSSGAGTTSTGGSSGASSTAGATGDGGVGADGGTPNGAGGLDGEAGAGGGPSSDLTFVSYVKSPLLPDGDEFGEIMAVDGNVLVVGTPPTVQVFIDAGSGFEPQAEIVAPSGASTIFGGALAVSGDTIVVGDLAADSLAGAAYVFVRQGIAWQPQGKLTASNGGGDYFGSGVAIDGDVIVVGAPFEDSSPGGDPDLDDLEDSGAAYVFSRDNGSWSESAILKADNADAADQFGARLAVSADTIIVGVPIEGSAATGVDGDGSDNSAQTRGASYIFFRDQSGWSQQAYLKPGDNDWVLAFGTTVAISGDIAVVGSEMEASSSSGVNAAEGDGLSGESGAAWVFVRSGTTWSPDAFIKAPNAEMGDYFGHVALDGNWLAVGAYREASAARGLNGSRLDNSASESGAVYTFFRDNGGWTFRDYIKAENAEAGDHFGDNVAWGGGTLVIAAPDESSGSATDPDDNSAPGAGALYVYR